jgi:hypothetical protein
MRSVIRRLWLGLCLVAGGGSVAQAQDAFEIQVYDSETAATGSFGSEVHLVYVADGVTRPEGGELPSHHVLHATWEPHIGLSSFLEGGFYLQTALRPDGTWDYAGFKGRLKGRVPFRFARGLLGFAANVEVSTVPAAYDAAELGMELRPILDLEWGRLYASVNPILAMDLQKSLAGHPRFEPAARLAVRAVSSLVIGGEYYGAIGPLDQLLPAAAQVHQLFGTVGWAYSSGKKTYTIDAGVGHGFVAGDRWVAKMILGFDIDR